MMYTPPQKAVLAVAIASLIALVFNDCTAAAVAKAQVKRQVELLLIHKTPTLAVILDCRYDGPQMRPARTLTDGKHTMIIQKGKCREA